MTFVAIEDSYRQPVRKFTPSTHIFFSSTKELVEEENNARVGGFFFQIHQ
jgi:hypothetical protein